MAPLPERKNHIVLQVRNKDVSAEVNGILPYVEGSPGDPWECHHVLRAFTLIKSDVIDVGLRFSEKVGHLPFS